MYKNERRLMTEHFINFLRIGKTFDRSEDRIIQNI